jgi:hypothetical protein
MRISKVAAAVIVGAMVVPTAASARVPNRAGSTAKGGAAGASSYDTKVKDFRHKNGAFKGTVKSDFSVNEGDIQANFCVEDRKVTIERKYTVVKRKNGKKITKTITEEVGSKRTDANGDFSLNGNRKTGKYKAIVEQVEFAFWSYYGIDGLPLEEATEMVVECLPAHASLD